MTRLADMAEGLASVLDERLAPGGVDVPRHFVLVAARLQDAEHAVAALFREQGPFDIGDPAVRTVDAGYALVEAARALMGYAVRLRARFTGQHAARAAEPLRAGLRALAAQPPSGDEPQILLSRAARALVLSAHAAEIAEDPAPPAAIGAMLEAPVQLLISEGVLPVLELAIRVQDGDVL